MLRIAAAMRGRAQVAAPAASALLAAGSAVARPIAFRSFTRDSGATTQKPRSSSAAASPSSAHRSDSAAAPRAASPLKKPHKRKSGSARGGGSGRSGHGAPQSHDKNPPHLQAKAAFKSKAAQAFQFAATTAPATVPRTNIDPSRPPPRNPLSRRLATPEPDDLTQLFGRMSINWYPGHMAAAKSALASRLDQAHLVIEVRDARIPFSSGNPELETLLRSKKKIIVLNKSDLGDTRVYGRVRRHFEARGQRIMHMTTEPVKRVNPRTVTGPRSKAAVTGVNRAQMRALHQLIAETLGPRRFSSVPPVILVVGLPNTGKSTLINQFRLYGKIALGINAGKAADDRSKEDTARMAKGGVAATGAEPGVTRGISGFLVSSPVPSAAASKTEVRVTDKLFLLDTPGIMLPYIPSDARGLELGLRLGAIAALKDLIIGPEILARYMLWALNRAGEYTYVDMLGLAGPTSDLECILEAVYLKRYAGTTVSNSRLFYEFQRRAARQKREALQEAEEREGAAASIEPPRMEGEEAEVESIAIPAVAPLRVPLDDAPASAASSSSAVALSSVRAVSNLSSEESLLCTNWFIKAFRRGELGRMVLDEMPKDIRPPQDPRQQTHDKVAVRNQRDAAAAAAVTATS